MLFVGALAVGVGFFGAWRLLNIPDYASVGPGIGFFGVLLAMASSALGLVLGASWLAYFHPGARAIAKVGSACLSYVVAMAFLSWAPWIPPRTYFTPEIVGVVKVAEYDPVGMYRVTLEDGRALVVKTGAQQNGQIGEAGRYAPLPGRIGISAGELLLAGEHPTAWYTGGWAAGSSSSDNVCYSLHGTGISRKDTVDFETGLRLRKAPDFGPRADVTEYGFQGDVCLNRRGEVTEIHGGI